MLDELTTVAEELTTILSNTDPDFVDDADTADKKHIITTPDSLSIIYFIIGSIGFLGNLLVVVVIFQYTAMRKSLTNRYIINQSLVDGAAGIAVIFVTIFEEDYVGGLGGTGGQIYCKLWLTKTLNWALFLSSTYNLVCLSIERYVAVVHPLKHKAFFSNTIVVLSLVFVWLIGIIFNLSLKIPTSFIKDGVCQSMKKWPSPKAQRGTGIFIIFLQFLVPLGIIGFCYGRMGVVLRNRVRPGEEVGQPKAGKSDEMTNKARRNIFKTLVIVSTCFVLCWIWNQSYLFLFNIGYLKIDFTGGYYHFSVIAVFTNCCVNPLIYIINYDQFRKGLKKLKSRLCGMIGDNLSSAGSANTHTTGLAQT